MLTLNGSTNYKGISFRVNDSEKGKIIQEATGSMFYDADQHMIIRTNGSNSLTQAMRIHSDGNVGIGSLDPNSTTFPSNKLDVDGQIRMRGTSGTAGYIPVSDADGVMTWTDPTTITTADDGDWTITNVNDMYSTPSGNVGIGTAPSGTSKLEVAGNIHIDNGGFIKSKGSNSIIVGSDDANARIGRKS